MRKILTYLAAGVLIIIAFATLGHMIGVAIGAAVAYWAFKSFLRVESLLGKLAWGIVGLGGLALIFGNLPAFIGVGALALLYYGYRSQKHTCSSRKEPFNHFEDEWKQVMKHY